MGQTRKKYDSSRENLTTKSRSELMAIRKSCDDILYRLGGYESAWPFLRWQKAKIKDIDKLLKERNNIQKINRLKDKV